jgi:glucan phosphoethanolaminetransferase (alkaline phosphatase superfamily)
MKKIIALLAFAIPAFASAQALSPITNVNNLTSRALGIGNTFTYILVALAVIYIVWNVVQYFIKANGGDRKEVGMNIIWGIVGLFIIVSIWGLVNILTNTFKTTPTDQAIPNLGTDTNRGGIPANQIPIVQ